MFRKDPGEIKIENGETKIRFAHGRLNKSETRVTVFSPKEAGLSGQ
jgi:hypothetical protein